MADPNREAVETYDNAKLVRSLRAIATWALYNDALGRAVLNRAADLIERLPSNDGSK
jgi:hypothetical protein